MLVFIRTFRVVPGAGIEPARLAACDFESPASTNFTTRARPLRLGRRGWKGHIICGNASQVFLHRIHHDARRVIRKAAPDDDFPGFRALQLDPAQQDGVLEVVALGTLPWPEYAWMQ